jgi:hypothetical protein
VERLYVVDDQHQGWQGDSRWLELLRPFTGVKEIYMSYENMEFIASALQELVGERVTENLPALQTLFLTDLNLPGPAQKTIDKFVAARQLAGHSVAISCWEREYDDIAEWY